MKKWILLLTAYATGFLTLPAQNARDVQKAVESYITGYKRADALTSPPTLKSCVVDENEHTISITGENGFKEQYFTPETVSRIYSDIRGLLPQKYQKYDLTVLVDGRAIEDLIPNADRSGHKDKSRLWQTGSQAEPWVWNTSRPFDAKDGLEGTHIALWQSHGRYWDATKAMWKWQRPRLFCSCEDLLSQTIVIPYIIPMLENAGAVVFTPRERDWQPHEVIVDNDAPQKNGAYLEGHVTKKAKFDWRQADGTGFAQLRNTYVATDHPFADGTARCIATVTNNKNASFAQWVPEIPERGRYAVYVSYTTQPASVCDARYRVFHKGGMTEFRVNQQMGGGTWVYLGTFEFDRGQHASGMVVLSNESSHNGVVTADAVRFGGGMGNIARGLFRSSGGTTSGLPRWAEAARYSQQWAGMPDSVYDYYEGTDDYKSDILSRPLATNELAGGSAYEPTRTGRKVPFELAVAFHTDAGYTTTEDNIGSLSICTTNAADGKTDAGLDRYTSHDLASMFLANLYTDLRKYHWNVRKLYNRNYGETRVPAIPAVIVEMLSHQNFADMQLAYDPQFKFDLSRSLYKTIVKYVAEMHQRSYVIQPLPVQDFSVTLDEKKNEAVLTWTPVDDPLETTARPTHYVVYTRVGYGDFDNGTVVRENSFTMPLTKDEIYSFRVCAVNKGGQSFPSETLAACIASRNEGTVLIVNGFTRLSGPQAVSTDTSQGFDLDADPGVPYGAFTGYCGRQTGFDLTRVGSEHSDGLGASGSELEGKVMMGNTFDYVFLHGKGVQLTRRHSFASCSESAFITANAGRGLSALRMRHYKMIDILFGVQKDFLPHTAALIETYCQQGGRIFVSGANLLKSQGLHCPSLHATYAGTLTDKSTDGIHGSGIDCSIYRNMNDRSYAVPAPEVLRPQGTAFSMLAYSDGQSAATAYGGTDCKAVTFGFPLESITDDASRNRIMQAVVNYLCQ